MNEYQVQNIQLVDSPALLIYPDRIAHNIRTMLAMVDGDADKLVPHVKTHKMAEVARMQVEAGITKFKCATIAEAEMLADTGARHVLISYQLTGPKLHRFCELVQAYNWVEWASLVDNLASAEELAQEFAKTTHKPIVYIDINLGMNRTGHVVDAELEQLYRTLKADTRLDLRGFHAYDGHIRDQDVAERQLKADAAVKPLEALADKLEQEGESRPLIIVGGTPTFSNHAHRPNVWCSPGTCLLWDWGYGDLLTEQHFEWAALLVTRVVSKPAPGIVTTDLGHKAVAAENPLAKRVKFLNLTDYELTGQSEEHLVLKVQNWNDINIGDVLYGVPYHICPTVALHDEAQVILGGEATGRWAIDARKRRITY
ncbi:D-TA family PLP-dependent enzyme [Larkinella rosea]|uniref:D-TA family PLP-dependent enzyme n=1 Tax=Larkinella rosea TaxID=2025312 RepID=A0A3P1BMV6_9BACT|nr:D-TA family PLP-dependent enzyme [Larkinella rosea]RRB02368.1 D-TA family PLP-dependent enzyme [Larkinella rosea]